MDWDGRCIERPSQPNPHAHAAHPTPIHTQPVASYVPVPITPISPLGAAMTFTPAQLETPALSFTVKYTPAAATKQRTIAQLMSASTTTTMYTTAAITNTTAAATATGTATAVAANEHDTTITTTSTSTRTSTSSAAAITAAAAAVLLVVLVGVAIFLVKHNGGTAGTAIEKMSAAVQEHGAWEQLEGLLFFLVGILRRRRTDPVTLLPGHLCRDREAGA